MRNPLLFGLTLALTAGCTTTAGLGGSEVPTKGAGPQLLYEVGDRVGRRASRDRESVLKTLKMNADQLREWAEARDEKAVKERRSATIDQAGYVEVIHRGAAGQLLYTVRDSAGSRTSRDRESVLKTRKMTADQIKEWAGARDEKAVKEGRSATLDRGRGQAQVAVRTGKGTFRSRDGKSASKAAKMTEVQVREWVEAGDEKAVKEGRSVTLFRSGYVETIDRGASDRLRYTVRTGKGTFTGRERDSVLKTLKMTDDQIREWAEAGDAKAVKEWRSAIFFRSGYVETISREGGEVPPVVER